MRILLTRPEADARRSADRLRALGHDVFIASLFEIVPTGARIPDGRFDRLLATSAHAFEHLHGSADPLKELPLDAVGERTVSAARGAGFSAVGQVAPDAKALGVLIARDRRAPLSFLYLAGRERRPELEAALAALGHSVTPWLVYETREAASAGDQLAQVWREGALDAVLHFSPRSAALYVALAATTGLTEAAMAPVQIVISQRAAQALDGAQSVRIAPSPDLQGLIACL